MEGYGRPNKGGGGMCGLNRGQQTLLFMVLMVGSMILVLCWESTPFTSEVTNPPHRDASPTSTSTSRSVDGTKLYETDLLDSRSLQSNRRVMSDPISDNERRIEEEYKVGSAAYPEKRNTVKEPNRRFGGEQAVAEIDSDSEDLSAFKIDNLESKTNLDVGTDESKETVTTTLKETMVRDMDGESEAEEIALNERKVGKTHSGPGEVDSNSPSTLRRERRNGGKVESEKRRTEVDGTDNATSGDDVSEDDSTQQLSVKTRKTEVDVDEVSETTSKSELVGAAKETMTNLDIEGTAPVAEKKERSATTESEVGEDSDVSRGSKLEAGPTTKARRSVNSSNIDTEFVEGSTTKSRGTTRVTPKDSDSDETTTETLDDELATAKKDAGLQITTTRLDESTTITKEDEELEASTGPALEKTADESDESEAAAPTLKKDRLLVNTSDSEIATETSKFDEELVPATGSSVSTSSLNSTKPTATATAATALLNSTKKLEVSEGGVQANSKSSDEVDISSEMESELDEEDGPIQQEVEANSAAAPKTCDYSVGRWVPDTSRPIYSGNECKLWLAAPFSCRLNHHPDLSFENYRWQPDGCDLPKWSGQAFLNRLQNKVLAFVGDSLGRQQLQSLMCMITHGKNKTLINEVGSEFGFYTPHGARKPTGYAYRFMDTNTTIVFVWTTTLALVEPLKKSDPATRNALHVDRPERFIKDHLPQLDVLILNSGHHWNGGKMKLNKYDFYYGGKPVVKGEPLSNVYNAYNMSIHSVVSWLSKEIAGTEKQVFYRSLSPRHFRNGDWNSGGTCDSIRFDKEVKVQEGDPTDPRAESAIRGTNVKLLNITSLSLLRGETHISKYNGGKNGQDCLHWCLPGIPDTWNEVLFAMLSPPIFRQKVAGTA